MAEIVENDEKKLEDIQAGVTVSTFIDAIKGNFQRIENKITDQQQVVNANDNFNRKITISTGLPSIDDETKDGDIWIVYETPKE